MRSQLPTAGGATAMVQREIDRFVMAARERSEYDVDTRRRALRRYHRSWPLLVSAAPYDDEISAALHNASPGGIGFLCNQTFPIGRVVHVKLFWHEIGGIRVPAMVRHVTPYRHAALTGCEFAIEDESACARALDALRWYD